jgi:hypothetical protein
MDHGSMFDGVWGPPASKPRSVKTKIILNFKYQQQLQ